MFNRLTVGINWDVFSRGDQECHLRSIVQLKNASKIQGAHRQNNEDRLYENYSTRQHRS